MKKTLKAQARQTEKKILEENKDFYNDITHKYFSKKSTPKRKVLLKACSIATACLLVVACLSIALYSAFKWKEPEYFVQNEVVIDSDINEINSIAPWFQIGDKEEYLYQIIRIYDSVSGDNLYFEVSLNSKSYFETIYVYLYINPYYKLQHNLFGDDIMDIEINGINVSYEENIEFSNEKYDLNYQAQYKKGKNKVFIKYNQVWPENDTHFFEFLEDFIQ